MESKHEAERAFKLIRRDAVDIFSAEGLHKRLCEGRPLRIKFGADPSRPDLHIGHSVVLRKLKLLQELGHEIIFVIGDFTSMIGDPSGQNKTRVPMTREQTRANGKTYFEQVTKILDKERTRIVYNSEWLAPLMFEDVFTLAGKTTLARMLERDDFSKRYRANRPIGLHELLYPLMQGYDSVVLNADIEVGGSDQTFNLLMGRELQKDYGQVPQEVITFPLLLGLDGAEKMSKSLDNYIGIDENGASMFEKCMKVPDALLSDYFRLTSDLSEKEYLPLIEVDIRAAHFMYARHIVTLYHGAEAAVIAERRYNAVASGGAPEDMDTIIIEEKSVGILELMRRCGFASSNSDARRLIEGGGIKYDGVAVSDPHIMIDKDGVLSRGKNRFVRVHLRIHLMNP